MIGLVGTGALALLVSGTGQSEKVDRLAIVDRAIEHHGGSLYDHSLAVLRMCSRSGCYDIRARMEQGRYRYDVTGTVGGIQRRVVSTNDDVLLWLDGIATEIERDRRSIMRDWAMARVYFCFLPYRLNDPSVFKQDLGLETWGGKDLQKIKVTFADGSSSDAEDEYLYWFDPSSGRIEQFAYSFVGDPGGLRFRRGIRYRRIGGILFFDQENFGVDGNHYSIDQVTEEFVSAMRHISTVELRDITVKSLE